MNFYFVLAFGMVAQGLFAARFVVQLARSELAGRVVSPVLFWQLSLLASLMLVMYGYFRNDPVIIGGQMVSYYIYIRNLQLKNSWQGMRLPLRYLFALLPPSMVLLMLVFSFSSFDRIINNPDIPVLLLTYGTLGQLVFIMRFVIQWLHSEKARESEFPPLFWIVSISGALLIVGYAIMRQDAVLFIGQFFGIMVYSRNLMLHYKPLSRIKANSVSITGRIKKYRLLLISGFILLALLVNINDWSVTESTEARYAQIANEMKESGDYLHPTLMDIKHYHKPPLTYWVTVAGYSLFGTNGFGARFFMQIAIVLQVLTVYGMAKMLLKSSKYATWAALLYFALPGVIMSGRVLSTDAYLCTFVLLSIFSWFKFAVEGRKGFLLLFYLFLGLGFFTKGPVVYIFPAFVVAGAYMAGTRPPKYPTGHIAGIVIMLAVSLWWFVYLYAVDSRFLDYFLFRHTVERFTTDVFRRSEPWWFFLAVVPAASFPWGVMLIRQFFRKGVFKKAQSLVYLMWIAGPVFFFSLSQSKMLLYVLPVYAGIAIGSIWFWVRMEKEKQMSWAVVQFVFQLIILGGIALAPLVEPDISISKQVYFLIVVTASIITALWFTPLSRLEKPVLAAVIFIYGIVLMSPYIFSANPEKVKDTRNIASYIENEIPGTNNILVYNRRLPSVQFNSGLNIISLYDGGHTLDREVQFEEDDSWKENLVNLVENPPLLEDLIKPGNVLLVRDRAGVPADVEARVAAFENLTVIDGWRIYYF